jgi:hypothetical protein
MSGKHRLNSRRKVWDSGPRRPRLWSPGDHPQRHTLLSAGLLVSALGIVIGLAASGVTTGDAQAQPLDRSNARIEPAPMMPIPVTSAPRDADEQHELPTAAVNERFLSGLAGAGISTAGREDELLTIAKRGAASHTTDADLEQSVRALFPDIDQVHSEKLVYQVRLAFPGDHSVDSDGDGR